MQAVVTLERAASEFYWAKQNCAKADAALIQPIPTPTAFATLIGKILSSFHAVPKIEIGEVAAAFARTVGPAFAAHVRVADIVQIKVGPALRFRVIAQCDHPIYNMESRRHVPALKRELAKWNITEITFR